MGGRLVTGSQETQATLISMPAKRAVYVCVFVCACLWVCVCVCCTDKRNWQLTAGGKGCVCARAFVCVSCLTQLDILTMLMRDQQRTIGEFHADFVLSRWHTMQGLALTHTRTHTPLHINTCVCFQSLTKKKYTQVQTLTNITVRPEFGLLSASVPLKNQLSLPLIKPVSFTWTPPLQINCTAC